MGDRTTITEWLVAQARATPDAVAVTQHDRRITYAELMDRATALAADLDAADPGDLVGVCAGRTPEMVVALAGVLLSGRGYVPLDPAYPAGRLQGLARQARLTTVVADEAGRRALPDLSAVDIPDAAPTTEPRTGWKPGPAGPDDVAYVSFTSGSTGQPKGVMVSHGNVSAFIASTLELLRVGPGDTALAVISLGFDPVVIDLWVGLASGSAMALVSQEDRADPGRLHGFARAHGVTWTALTPALLAMLDPDRVPTLRTLICGGDVIPAPVAARWQGRRLINVYGPTEATVFVLHADLSTLDYDGEPPMGRPSGAHCAYVVDEQLREVAPGEPGELLIGGPGVALGYLDQPELTAERFVADPQRPGERVYRTGDIVRLDGDGLLHFVGRRDGQVKIRGQRVEVGEVSAVLRTHPEVADAAVEAVRGPGGDFELIAFVVAQTDTATLAQYARERLTTAMVPRRFVRLDRLPTGLTDKVDREALRQLAEIDLPEDPVAAAWTRALGVAPGPDADFFADGGHSIAAMKLVAELRTALKRDLVVEDVFAGRTFEGFRERVEHAAPLDHPDVAVGNPPTLSPSQRRLWFLDQLAPDSAAYNVVFAERLRGDLDVLALRLALKEVAERHEVLRWRIRHHGGVPYALRDGSSDVDLPVLDGGEERLPEIVNQVFDLATGPVWRAGLLRVNPQEHILCVVMHHAVADGWSQAPFYADLAKAYAGQALARPEASFSDYAVWRANRDNARADGDLAWWREHLADAPTVVDLPRDHARPPVQTYTGAFASKAFSDAADAGVRTLATRTGATASVVVLAAIGEALRRLTGRADNVIGAVLADRRLTEFHDLIGFFVDIVPLRLRAGAADFAADVRAALAELLAVQAHPGVPLERIVDGLGLPRDPSRAPLVQVLFNVFNFTQPHLDLPGLTAEPVTPPLPGSPFDLTLYLVEKRGRFVLDAVFNPDLYAHERTERLLSDVIALIGALCANASSPASESGPRFDTSGADRTAPAPAPRPAPATGPQAARTETEVMLAAVWSAVLGRPVASVSENFFDLGGTSMAMAEVRARLGDHLGREVPMVDLFRYPNIHALAAYLDRSGSEHAEGAAEDPELVRAAHRAALRRSRSGRRTTREGDA